MNNAFRKMKSRVIKKWFLLACCAVPSMLYGQQRVAGDWQSIDDETGKAKSVVRISENQGILSGVIIRVLDPSMPDPVCSKCSGSRKNQKIVGMDIFLDMKFNPDEQLYTGAILDPETGKIYDCRIWRENGKLHVRGYVMMFYRTQTWVPYAE